MAAFINRLIRRIGENLTRREWANRRAMTAAVVLSLLIHGLALWRMPPVKLTSTEYADKQSGPLIVRLVPPPSPPTPPSRPSLAQRPAIPQPPRPRVEPRAPPPAPSVRRAEPPPPPPVLARKDAAPSAPRAPVTPPAPTPPAPSASPPGDFAAAIEARRRARGEAQPAPAPLSAAIAEPQPPTAPAEDPNTRATRLAAANLGLNRPATFGPDPRKGGGIFGIRRLTDEYAEFTFYGWNRDIRRNTGQIIEVRRGTNPTIQIAVVRRMIEIIREHEQGDFVWESLRLNRNVTLSARLRDNGGLEDFLMREFFEPGKPAAR